MRRLLMPLVCLLSISGCVDDPVTVPVDVTQPQMSVDLGPVLERVTGSGHFEAAPPALTLGWRTFTMTIRKHADGSVWGGFTRVSHLADGGVERNRGIVTCFTIVGNTAWVGGETDDGVEVAWQIVDNGEGVGAPADRVGLLIPADAFGFPPGFDQQFCEDTPTELDFGPLGVLPLAVILFDIEAGDVSVEAM